MALSLDKYLLSVPGIKPHVELKVDFVGFFKNWSTTNLTECQTSSSWSDCIVNAYHLCGHATADAASNVSSWAWWDYTHCMYEKQYPQEECAGMNPLDKNHTCTEAEFPGIMRDVSDECAEVAGLDASKIDTCVEDGQGLELLKRSFNKTVTFPKNPHGYIEPQWIEVDGPSCGPEPEGNWTTCKPAFDKTHCEDWDHCDHDSWAKHLLQVVCSKSSAGKQGSPGFVPACHNAAAAAVAAVYV